MRRVLASRSGLSIVELLVAMLVLTVGILGMAAGTGWMIRTVDLSRLDTERAAAMQAAVEGVRATPYAQIGAGSQTEGIFEVSWAVVDQNQNGVQLEFVVVGAGREPGSIGPRPTISQSVSDTLHYWMTRP